QNRTDLNRLRHESSPEKMLTGAHGRVSAVTKNSNNDASISSPKPSSTISLSRSRLIRSLLSIALLPFLRRPLIFGGRPGQSAFLLRVSADEQQRQLPANHLVRASPPLKKADRPSGL